MRNPAELLDEINEVIIFHSLHYKKIIKLAQAKIRCLSSDLAAIQSQESRNKLRRSFDSEHRSDFFLDESNPFYQSNVAADPIDGPHERRRRRQNQPEWQLQQHLQQQSQLSSTLPWHSLKSQENFSSHPSTIPLDYSASQHQKSIGGSGILRDQKESIRPALGLTLTHQSISRLPSPSTSIGRPGSRASRLQSPGSVFSVTGKLTGRPGTNESMSRVRSPYIQLGNTRTASLSRSDLYQR